MMSDFSGFLELPMSAERVVGAAIRALAEGVDVTEPVAHDGQIGTLEGFLPQLALFEAASRVGVTLAFAVVITVRVWVDMLNATLEVSLVTVELMWMDHDD
jgi:hypothetical protein